ncbi:MAG: hypothetical protein RR342_02310 [Bacilli bacterium]
MKKVLCYFTLLFAGVYAAATSFLVINTYSVKDASATFENPIEVDSRYTPLTYFINKDFVYRDGVSNKRNFYEPIKMALTTIDLNCNKFKNGDIVKKGDIVDGNPAPFTFRIRKINLDSTLVENLEDATIIINFFNSYFIDPNDYNVKTVFMGVPVKMTSKDLFFNEQTKSYNLVLKCDNLDGRLLNNAKCTITITTIKKIEGLFVKSDYIFNDNFGDFVYKFANINFNDYYTKVYVNVRNGYFDFVNVEGDLYEKNIILRL